MEYDITELFCFVDDFIKETEKKYLTNQEGFKKPTRTPDLVKSEIITILIMYQYSRFRNFKAFYKHLLKYHLHDFPKLGTYDNFIRLKQKTMNELIALTKDLIVNNPKKTDIYYVDSTDIMVCTNKRINSHRVFKNIAATGKTTKGWFYGLKLHVVIDAFGEIQSFDITKGNIHDVNAVEGMTKHLQGLMFGDKGYISKKLFDNLFEQGLKFITNSRKNMKVKLITLKEKVYKKKRSIIETFFDYLKNKMQLVHTRHRSIVGGFIHIISTLIAYQMYPDKPTIIIRDEEIEHAFG